MLAEEYNQVFDLVVYLRGLPCLNGVTFVLKNWEGDNQFCNTAFTDAEIVAVPGLVDWGDRCRYSNSLLADATTKQAMLNRATHYAKWFRERQDAVSSARIATPNSSVPVYLAVDVSDVEAAAGTHDWGAGGPWLRLGHLLPYVGSDMISYTAFPTIYDGSLSDMSDNAQLYSTLTTYLYAAFDFLTSQNAQKNAADAMCRDSGVCLSSVGFGGAAFPERTPDPSLLGSKRLLIAEYFYGENRTDETSQAPGRIPAVLDACRCYPAAISDQCVGGIRASFWWALYDNDMVWEKTCLDPYPGRDHQCRSGGVPLCDSDGNSTVPGVSCVDKNLWERLPEYTLGDSSGNAGPGNCIYRPDGFECGSLAILRQYTMQTHAGLWTPDTPGPPTNLHFSVQPFVLGSPDVNALIWDLPAPDYRYITYEIEVSGPQSLSTTTYHRWYTLGASLPAGAYIWKVRATTAGGLLTSQWVNGPSFRIAASSRFYAVTPCRAFDTRNPVGPLGGPALAPNGQRTFGVAGICGIPVTAVSVSANVTVVPAASGTIGLFPANLGDTGTSVLSFNAGKTRANNTITMLSTDGNASVLVTNSSAGANHIIFDVNGYFQ